MHTFTHFSRPRCRAVQQHIRSACGAADGLVTGRPCLGWRVAAVRTTGMRCLSHGVTAHSEVDAHAPLVDSQWKVGKVKRRVSVVVSYNGRNFHGSQWNPPHRTVEEDVYNAVVACGGVHPLTMGGPSGIKWSRTSRTDRGVHALRNVFRFKMWVDKNQAEGTRTFDFVADELNACLPEDIRVLDVVQTSKSFDARRDCVTRQFRPSPPGDESSTIDELNTLLQQYLGTVSFHNFTSERYRRQGVIAKGDLTSKCMDDWEYTALLQRTLYHFQCEPAFDDMWRIRVVGSGFLYHHIRFMIGTAVGVLTGVLPRGVIQQALVLPNLQHYIDLPLAPSSPLVLTDLTFERGSRGLYLRPGRVCGRAPFRAKGGTSENSKEDGDGALCAIDDAAVNLEEEFFLRHMLPDIRADTSVMGEWVHELVNSAPNKQLATSLKSWESEWSSQLQDKRDQDAATKALIRNEALQTAISKGLWFIPNQPKGLPMAYRRLLPPGTATRLSIELGIAPGSELLTYVQRGCVHAMLSGRWGPTSPANASALVEHVRRDGIDNLYNKGIQGELHDTAIRKKLRQKKVQRSQKARKY